MMRRASCLASARCRSSAIECSEVRRNPPDPQPRVGKARWRGESLEDARVAQASDLVLGHAEQLVQDCVGVLAEAWSRRSQARLHVGEADRVSFCGMRAEDGMVDVPEVAAMCDLRVVVQVREIGDRARIDAGGLEAGGEGGGALRA